MGNELIIGDKLRQARLNKNISIDELQKKTRIQKRYLEAIEQGNFDLLPGDYYVRAFLRDYAAVVGEDGNFLVAVFDGEASFEAPIPKRPVPERVQGSRVAVKKQKSTLDYVPMILLGLIALTIVTIVLYMTWQDRRATPIIGNSQSSLTIEQSFSKTTESSVTATETTESSVTQETTSSSEEKKMTIEMKNSTQAQADIQITNAEKPVELTFKGKNDRCWVGISVDGAYIYQYTLVAGEEQKVTLPENATNAVITLGASANIDILANNEAVDFDDSKFELLQKNLNVSIDYAE